MNSNNIRTNYVKAKTDNMPENNNCSERDKAVNYLISKLAKKVIQRQKRQGEAGNLSGRSYHTDKWYMHNKNLF